MHSLSGRKQSAEHIHKRVEATAQTKAQWSEERHAQFQERERSAVNRRSSTIKDAFMKVNVGRKPWNKGNDWREKYTPEEVRAITAERARRRRANHPGRRIHESMSAMIRQAIRQDKTGKSWESLVGYTLEDLLEHLEQRFTEGMSWDNYGDWQIDHIKPRAAFYFSTPNDPEFLECWALDNLQPLWARDNLLKGIN